MALTRLARSSSSNDPLLQLGKVISDLLPHRGLPLIDEVRRWSDRLLVLAALMMGWASGSSLVDRFNLARACVVEIHPTRKRPGTGYNGFIDCLARHSTRLLGILTAALRKRLIELAGESYRTFGFIVFGADGTKIQLPRSDSNIAHFGIANKKHSGPEMILCGLFHVATRSLWSFAHDVARGSERALLASMLPCLPTNSLILADAGFVGWNTMAALIDAGQHFIIRGGANVRLLRNLGHMREHDGIVYLWPDIQQKKKVRPIMLRCVMVRDGRGRQMCLLTNVLDADRLSDEQIVKLYAMRWHVEVSYRWLKQSLHGRKMLSTSAQHARLEMDWTMMSLWTLTLISLAQGVPGQQLSLAGTLRIVRAAMTQRRITNRQRLSAQLRRARRDGYTRRNAKTKRPWPRKARLHRCGIPLARTANADEIRRFQSILPDAA
jgi:Transposase DDE domain